MRFKLKTLDSAQGPSKNWSWARSGLQTSSHGSPINPDPGKDADASGENSQGTRRKVTELKLKTGLSPPRLRTGFHVLDTRPGRALPSAHRVIGTEAGQREW